LELLGSEVPLPGASRVSLQLNGGAKRALFLRELFPELPPYLNAALRIRAGSGIATLVLLGVTNERGNYLMAALTGEPGRETLAPGRILTLPRFAAGGGYRTILYLLRESPGAQTETGRIRFFDSQGAPQLLFFR
jgi:hypothetical protein